ncbi:hypothetical protein D3C72_699760 [compost metagenome]
MMKCPIVIAREKQSLTRTQAAVGMGVNYCSLTRLEKGLVASLSEVWRPRFTLMGWDFDLLQAQYSEWHKARIGLQTNAQ